MKKNTLFWIFGILQTISLNILIWRFVAGLINATNLLSTVPNLNLNLIGGGFGIPSAIPFLIVGFIFSISLLVIEYLIYTKK